MTTVYWIGKLVVIEWTLVDLAGAPITTATVTGTITQPDETTATATISQASNIYRASYDPTLPGTHAYRLVATGTADSAEEGTFEVQPHPGAAPPAELDPGTDVGMVRLLIPDRNCGNLLLTDAEITGYLSLEGGAVKRAAAAALEAIATSEALTSKVLKDGDLATDGAKLSAELRARAKELRRQADEDDPDTAGALDIVDFVDPFNRRWPAEGTEPEVWC